MPCLTFFRTSVTAPAATPSAVRGTAVSDASQSPGGSLSSSSSNVSFQAPSTTAERHKSRFMPKHLLSPHSASGGSSSGGHGKPYGGLGRSASLSKLHLTKQGSTSRASSSLRAPLPRVPKHELTLFHSWQVSTPSQVPILRTPRKAVAPSPMPPRFTLALADSPLPSRSTTATPRYPPPPPLPSSRRLLRLPLPSPFKRLSLSLALLSACARRQRREKPGF